MAIFPIVVATGEYTPGKLLVLPGTYFTNLPVGFELDNALQIPRKLTVVLEYGMGANSADWAAWLSRSIYGLKGVAVMTAFQELGAALYFPERNRELVGQPWTISKQY